MRLFCNGSGELTTPSLDGVWAKVGRAQEHAHAVKTDIQATLASSENRPFLAARFDAERSQNVVFVKQMPDLSEAMTKWSVISGDALHTFRSALDHLVYQLALRHTGGKIQNERRLQFPITGDAQKWIAERDHRLAEVSTDDQLAIERYQAYQPVLGEAFLGPIFHPLALLSELNNVDKHRLLNTIIIPGSHIGVVGQGIGGVLFMMAMTDMLRARDPRDPKPLQAGAILGGTGLLKPLKNEVPVGSVSPRVAFPQGGPVDFVLDLIGRWVVKVIREFEPFP